jgi:L-fuculose-phosphate aldolase
MSEKGSKITSQKIQQEIIKVGKFIYDKGYIVATDGNISVRINSKEILITRSGVCKGEMNRGDIVRLSLRGTERRGNLQLSKHTNYPSTEYRFHLAIYQNRPDVNAIIHAHPPYSTTFAVTGKKLDVKILTETEETLGQIGYVGYYKPGSIELAEAVGKACRKHNTMLLAHHGVVVCGKDLTEARYRLERMELLSKVTLLASLFKS